MKKMYLSILLLTIIAQLYVPLSMVARYEKTISGGEEYTFKARIYDPYDAFRGRYINITADAERSIPIVGFTGSDGDYYYATIKVDEEGIASFDKAYVKKPKGVVCAKVKGYKTGSMVNVYFPQNRYYMKEKHAEEAENIYRKNVEDCTIKVRVRDGQMLIDGVFIDGVSIEDLV